MTTVSVCIGTFGSLATWAPMARRAICSAERQTLAPVSVTWVHQSTLAKARNAAASVSTGEWLVFCDADDELANTHCAEVARVAATIEGDGLLQPLTLGVRADGVVDAKAIHIPHGSMIDRNYLVIGTAIRASQFKRLGGFDEYPCYEDWDLYLRAVLDGATVHKSNAVYRVHVNPGSRNQGHRETQVSTYNTIRSKYLAEWRRRWPQPARTRP